jgi:lipopolysaccharide transport system permease protein
MKTSEHATEYHIHISSDDKALNFNFKELLHYRDLIVLLTKKTFILTYKQTILGPAWIFLNPFLTSLMYMVVFGKIAGLSTNGVPQLLFYLGGSAIWTYFSTSISKISKTFTDNANVFGKVYFPRLCVPISTIITSLINFGVQMLMFLALWIYYIARGAVRPHYEAIPLILVVLLELGVLGFACGIIVSSLTTKYHDLTMLVTFGIQLWMYGTPVVYPLSQLNPSGTLYKFIYFNPVTPAVEMFRYIFLGTGVIHFDNWCSSCIATVVLALIGVRLFNRVEKNFMDTV